MILQCCSTARTCRPYPRGGNLDRTGDWIESSGNHEDGNQGKKRIIKEYAEKSKPIPLPTLVKEQQPQEASEEPAHGADNAQAQKPQAE
jgi:hypothetical protein